MDEKTDVPFVNLPKIRFNAQPDNFGCRIVGEVYQQVSPFQWHKRDWNYDGDVYGQKIADFEKLTDINAHSPNYFCLSEYDFLNLKQTGCLEYVKEQTEEKTVQKTSLDKQITKASSIAERTAGQGRTIVQMSFKNDNEKE